LKCMRKNGQHLWFERPSTRPADRQRCRRPGGIRVHYLTLSCSAFSDWTGGLVPMVLEDGSILRRKTWPVSVTTLASPPAPSRCNAFMIAIRASISGPSRSATSNSASICDLPIGRIELDFWQRGDVLGGIAQRQQFAPVRTTIGSTNRLNQAIIRAGVIVSDVGRQQSHDRK